MRTIINKNALKAGAFPIHVNPKTGKYNKRPVYWEALVIEGEKTIWSDGGWHSKRAALSVAANWINSRG